MIYVLDTNTVSDFSRHHTNVVAHFQTAIRNLDDLVLTIPVYYEARRGLLRKNARVQLHRLRNDIVPLMSWVELLEEDWLQAGQFWVDAVRQGRQLSDIDLLIAAIAHRLDAVIVSSDTDYDILNVKREDWRQ